MRECKIRETTRTIDKSLVQDMKGYKEMGNDRREGEARLAR